MHTHLDRSGTDCQTGRPGRSSWRNGQFSGIADKRVLIISYAFAPNSRVGGKRFSYLSTLLSKGVDELHVLTVDERHILRKDQTIPCAGEIHRTRMYPAYPVEVRGIAARVWNRLWYSYLCVLDPFSGWIPTAVRRGSQLIRSRGIDLVITTGPPFSSHVIGSILSKRHGIPLILDYRDPWSNRKESIYPRMAGAKVNSALEPRCINEASAVVLNTPFMEREFLRAFGNHVHGPTAVITNGYTPSEIEPLAIGAGTVNIVYAGNLYGRRSLSLLGDAMARLISDGAVGKGALRVHVFGKIMAEDRPMLAEKGVGGMFVEHGPVDHRTILRLLKGADALLLVVGRDMDYSISYKFYDYLCARRPILALVPSHSQMMETMGSVDCGVAADCEDPEAVYRALKRVLKERQAYSFGGAERYTWEASGGRYLELIRSVNC
jgi:glycosyltransferase involved in cell wall biosynthesis